MIILPCIYVCMDFLDGPMADERKLNGSPSINKDYYYYYHVENKWLIHMYYRWH